MPSKQQLIAIYEVILRAEIAVMDATETNNSDDAARDQISIAIDHLDLASLKLKTIRTKSQ